MNNRNLLNKRGLNILTTEERGYYNKESKKRGFTDLEVTMPKIVIDRAFEELKQNSMGET